MGSKKYRTAAPALAAKMSAAAAKAASEGRGWWIFGGMPDRAVIALVSREIPMIVVDVKVSVGGVGKQYQNPDRQTHGRKDDSDNG